MSAATAAWFSRTPRTSAVATTVSAPTRGIFAGISLLTALFGYALLVGTYFVVRSTGLVADSDSAAMTLAIRATASSGSLIPDGGALYGHGFQYTAISQVLLAFTGVNVAQLQQAIYPLLSALLVFPAWALYREVCGTRPAAALSVLLLFSQPEFLFVIMRGSHERVLRALML